MGQLDNQSDNLGLGDSRSAESILQTVTQDLRALQQDLVAQLGQDIRQLQAERSRLMNEVEKLQAQQRELQVQQQVTLTQQQQAQQQVWAKQLAQVLATHLYAILVQRLNQLHPYPVAAGLGSSAVGTVNGEATDPQRVLSSLDVTLNRTLNSLRQDLNSYQSSLSQQISRMHTMEQQGEAILEALVSRLSHQLQAEAARAQGRSVQSGGLPTGTDGNGGHYSAGVTEAEVPGTAPGGNGGSQRGMPAYGVSSSYPPAHRPEGQSLRSTNVLPVAPATAPEPAVASMRPARPKGLSQFQQGLALVLLSTVALSLHNVVVGILGYPSRLFGAIEIGNLLSLNFGNSLLLLWMRMLLVTPALALCAKILHPSTWRDIKDFTLSRDRRLLGNVVGSGFFLFLSQVLIYIAIGQIGPGVAVTILFMYPVVTVPLAWWLFGDRPTSLRFAVMFAILLGVVLTASPRITTTNEISWVGIITAATSGIAFACYLIAMQVSFRKLHPVPVTLIQFSTIFLLTSLSLILLPFFLPLGINVFPEHRLGLVVGGIILSILTLLGYLCNNFGVRYMGAARASIIASSGPVLTALLAVVVTPGARTALVPIQGMGILLVTVGVMALSFERMLLQTKAAKAAAKG